MPACTFFCRSVYCSVIFALAFATAPLTAQAPTTSGTLVTMSGTVADSSGGVLSDATVEALVNGRRAAITRTDAEGRYRLELAPNTAYQIQVRRQGFIDLMVPLQTGLQSITSNIRLELPNLYDTLVVTASRTPETLAATTASVSIFDATDLAALGSTSIGDVLRMVPGVNAESNGREGGLTSVFSRGGESDYNFVLIDGVRVNANGGQYDFGRVSGQEIERVEVVRGAQSALYGSNAIGTAVQIFTRRSGPFDGPQLRGALEGGTFNTWRGNLYVSGGARQRIDYHAGFTYRSTDGAFGAILPERDRYDQPTFNGGLGLKIGTDTTLRTGLRVSRAEGRAPGPIAYGSRETGTSYQTKDLSWHLDLEGHATPNFFHSVTTAYFRSRTLSADRIADPPYFVYAVLRGTPGAIFPNSPRLVRLLDAATFNALSAGSTGLASGEFLATTPFGAEFGDFPFTTRTRFRRPAFKYQGNFLWRSSQLLTSGYEFERESNPLTRDVVVDNHAYFVQQQFKWRDRWFTTAGARVDDNSRFGTSASPKISVGGFLRRPASGAVSSVKVTSNIGRGIKTPTFDELFGSSFVDGNPNLHAERARTIDVGAEVGFATHRWLSRVTYFDNRFTDQVAYKASGARLDGLADYLNIDGSRARGLELEGALRRSWSGILASGWYSLVDTKVVSSVSTSEQFQPGQPLLRRPKHSAAFRLTYVRGKGSLNFQARYIGQRHDAAFLGLFAVPSPQFPGGRPVDITVNPGYTLIGLGGDVRLHEDLTIYVRLDNVTDTSYESALGYPGLPRALTLGGRFLIGR